MRRLTHLACAASIAAALTACDNPAKDKPQATVSSAEPLKPATSAMAAASVATYAIDPATSKVEWEASKVTRKHQGSFGAFTGQVQVPDGKPELAKITLTIEVASIKADEEKLTGHLKSPDFFDAAQFPKATFESTAITPGGAAGATHTITGNLTMHGQTKSITFPATVTFDAAHVTAKSEFVLKRKDFGIVYPGLPNDLIREDVLVKLNIDAPKKT